MFNFTSKKKGKKIMHNGFYKELDSLKTEYPEANFSFMENIFPNKAPADKNDIRPINAHDFLHGYCCTFAYYLSRRYGYSIIVRKPKNNNTVIHAWCEKNNHYIDIRGITNQFNEFWEEYEDFDNFDPEDDTMETCRFTNPQDFKDYIGQQYEDFSLKAIETAICLHQQYKTYYQIQQSTIK